MKAWVMVILTFYSPGMPCKHSFDDAHFKTGTECRAVVAKGVWITLRDGKTLKLPNLKCEYWK